ncbi:DUF2254 domain-containing protein [Noviherbaspirillum sp. ST9]|uniref:DUF2254 domain-containing protein n=1 Tax=Noviherbaspirillum sp. ST9 TaxID=3401606 RepID=UPI003B587DB5
MLRLLQVLQDIRYSLWFIPTLVVGFAIGLAVLAIEVDTRIGDDILSQWPRLFGASADGARALLQTVAAAMITVAGLTFSITVLVLSLAASQYTPRVIRTFMGSRPTQMVLGTFIGIFCYCLVVMRAIRGTDEAFVPSVAVTVAMLFALIGVGVLVYFIHHMATSIQVSTIVSHVAAETVRMVDATYGSDLPAKEDNRNASPPGYSGADWFGLKSARTGYLRSVDFSGLARYASEHGIIVRMERKIGDFVIDGGLLASMNRKPDAQMEAKLNGYFNTGHYRTVEQDPAVGVQQLVDIALRALSPGVNDTTTALLCIDYLSSIFARMAPLQILPDHCRHEGNLRVMRCGDDFHDMLGNVVRQIGESGKGSLTVSLRLLDALDAIARCAQGERRRFLVDQIARIASGGNRHLDDPDQIAALEQRGRAMLARLPLAVPPDAVASDASRRDGTHHAASRATHGAVP